MEEREIPQFATAKSFSHQNTSEYQIQLSELCEKNPSDIFVNKNIDNLLQTSFVEIERIASNNNKEDLTSYSSGQNFFLKTNSLFLESRGMANKKSMKNKKVQCQIGSGYTSIMVDVPQTYEGKMKRLQILKIIKLLRVIFKQLKIQRSIILQQITQQKEEYQTFLKMICSEWQKCFSGFDQRLKEKDKKNFELELYINDLESQNDELKGKLECETAKSSIKIKELQSQNLRSLSEINQEYKTNSQMIQELTQKQYQYETQIASLTHQVNNLNEVLHIKQTQIKKLQYQVHRLQIQHKELCQKSEELFSKYIENEQKYDEECQNSEIKDEKTQEILRLNDLYLKQVESCKEEIKGLQEQNEKNRRQTDDIINQQLRKYQQYFNEELSKAKKEFNIQLFNKNAVINQYISREQLYNQIIEKMQQPLISGSKQQKIVANHRRITEKDQQNISGKQNEDSNLKISKKIVNKNSNFKNNGKPRCSQVERDNQTKVLVSKLKRMKNRSVEFHPQKIESELIFKATNPFNSRIKLSEYFKLNQTSALATEENKRIRTQQEADNMSHLSQQINKNIEDYYRWKISNQ